MLTTRDGWKLDHMMGPPGPSPERPGTPGVSLTLPLPLSRTSSMMSVSQLPGMKPAPIPWILCGPGLPPDSTGLSVGSTATTSTLGFFSFR
jgi:hypothetical protein